jgi:hypothetical protein
VTGIQENADPPAGKRSLSRVQLPSIVCATTGNYRVENVQHASNSSRDMLLDTKEHGGGKYAP